MSPKNKSGKDNRYYSGTKVDNPTILFCTSTNAQFGNASTTQHGIKNSKEIRSVNLLGVRENFISGGLPEATVKIIMSPWRTSEKEIFI